MNIYQRVSNPDKFIFGDPATGHYLKRWVVFDQLSNPASLDYYDDGEFFLTSDHYILFASNVDPATFNPATFADDYPELFI